MGEHLYSTYIVTSRSRTLYIGVTGDLRKRVFENKWKEHDGFTEHCNCDRLVRFEHYQEIAKAIAREKQLKRWSRPKKIILIERMNPARVDLAEIGSSMNRPISSAQRTACSRKTNSLARHSEKLQIPQLRSG